MHINRQYLDDEDFVNPLVCAWDFVIQRDSRKVVANETAALNLHVSTQ
jgi:hypothetical protein